MNNALDLAREAFKLDEVPVGAIITYKGKIIGRGFNKVIIDNDVSSHAEINGTLPPCLNLVSILFPCIVGCFHRIFP